jgi:hypothetical protein
LRGRFRCAAGSGRELVREPHHERQGASRARHIREPELANPFPNTFATDRYWFVSHRTRSPVSGPDSIVTRKSAPANSEVSLQITTEEWFSGMAFGCTMTAGRGWFPVIAKRNGDDQVTWLIGIEFGYGFDPEERVAFALRVENITEHRAKLSR